MLRVSPDASCDFGERGCVLHSNVNCTYNKPRLDASFMSEVCCWILPAGCPLTAVAVPRVLLVCRVPRLPTCLNSATSSHHTHTHASLPLSWSLAQFANRTGVEEEMTSIWDEVLDGNIAGIRSLLDDGVGVDERNWLGETPLHLAARYGLEDMATVRKRKGGWSSVEYSKMV